MSVQSTWLVTGMHCGGCAKRVRTQLEQKITGFESVDIDPKAGTVHLVTGAVPDEAGIREAVTTAGYTFVGAQQ
jgi:copper chaperone CopZ